jgi:16S rRNA (cytosine1402-N4)-methyltransferase
MDRALAERDLLPVDGMRSTSACRRCSSTRPTAAFAFSNDGPLDMRMSQSGQTAAEFLNEADEAEIARHQGIWRGAARPRGRPRHRRRAPADPHGRAGRGGAQGARPSRQGMKSDPATRTFQAIRIHLNAELDELEQGLRAAERSLARRRAAWRW